MDSRAIRAAKRIFNIERHYHGHRVFIPDGDSHPRANVKPEYERDVYGHGTYYTIYDLHWHINILGHAFTDTHEHPDALADKNTNPK